MLNEYETSEINIENSEDLTDIKIKHLRAATKRWIKNNGFKKSDMKNYHIPWYLLILPAYHEARALHAEETGKINNIVANWDNDIYTAGKINLRTDGKYKGLFFIVDGYSRFRAMERLSSDLGFDGVITSIVNIDKNKEIETYASKNEVMTPLNPFAKYVARNESTDTNNRKVAAVAMVNNVLNKYHLDSAIHGSKENHSEKIAIQSAINICTKSIQRGDECFDWIIDILKTSGAAMTNKGLSEKMLKSFAGFYYMLMNDRFSGVTPADAKPVLIEKMHHHTYGTIQDLGIAILKEDPVHVLMTDSVSRAKAVFSHWICESFGLPTHEYI